MLALNRQGRQDYRRLAGLFTDHGRETSSRTSCGINVLGEIFVSATLRRVVYVVSYELIAIVATTFGLSLLGFSGSHSSTVAVVSSAVALIWNYLFNMMFDAWEQRQDNTQRTLRRRIAHALGFEGGLVVILVPILALILGVTILEALMLEAGLLVFFLIYTFVFAWVFDKIVPRAKQKAAAPSTEHCASM